MTSIRDVARIAEVSVSTVSHVINGTRHVEPATVLRVRQAIEELNYQPNSLARSLRHGKTHTIGLLVPDNSNPFFAEVARIVENEGFNAGYSVILCNSDGSESKEDTYVSVLLAKQVDGLIFAASSNRLKGLPRVLSAKVPAVALDRELSHSPIAQILVDHWHGGYIAGEYLLKLGHRQFAYIAGPHELSPSAYRLGGFQQALKEADLTIEERAICVGDFRFLSGQKAVQELLERGIQFTALFAANDLMAMGAISILHAKGLRVPQDVSVIGFDDIPYAATTMPPLTTIAQPIEALGKLCVQMLIETMQHPEQAPQRMVLLPQLVIRESCAPVNGLRHSS